MTGDERDPFEAGTWEGAVLARLREEARWPLSRKLEWLEEAQQLARDIQTIREKADDER